MTGGTSWRSQPVSVGAGRILLEKDIWVVHTLAGLIETSFGADLTFKGGTSLAKAYHAIRRFSEDLDITYDIRAIAPDLLTNGNGEAIPATRSQERRWTREIRGRLPGWVVNQALPSLEINLAQAGLSAGTPGLKETMYSSPTSLCLTTMVS